MAGKCRNRSWTAVFAVIILLIISGVILADDTGGETFAFLNDGIGVRATGMGGAYCAVSDDMSAVLYNPAGIVKLPDLQLMAETYLMSFGRSISYLSVGKPFTLGKNICALGFSWINYSAGGDIEMRQTDSDAPDSVFSDSSDEFLFTAATYLSRNFFVGGNFKFLTESLGKAKGVGMGFDLGLYLEASRNITAGLCFNNISSSLNWSNSTHVDNLPNDVTGGISYNAADPAGIKGLGLTADTDIYYSSAGYVRPKLGMEVSWQKVISIRAGFDRTLSAGLGVKIRASEMLTLMLDYAYRPDTILADESNHRIGISMDYIFPKMGLVEDADGKSVNDMDSAPENSGDNRGRVKDNEW